MTELAFTRIMERVTDSFERAILAAILKVDKPKPAEKPVLTTPVEPEPTTDPVLLIRLYLQNHGEVRTQQIANNLGTIPLPILVKTLKSNPEEFSQRPDPTDRRQKLWSLKKVEGV